MVYQIEPKNEFLVGIDSDGCVFDTMELKHKECFIPNIINYYELQGVSKYAREAAEFVNLYSKSRGINRFPALVEALEWLQKRPEVIERGAKINIPQSLQTCIPFHNYSLLAFTSHIEAFRPLFTLRLVVPKLQASKL